MYRINYCGYNISNPDRDVIYRPNGSGDYLFLLVQSPMEFFRPRLSGYAEPGACMLYAPGLCQHYQAVKEFRNSFVHFSADSTDLEFCAIPENTVFYPGNQEEINYLLRQIYAEYLTKDLHYEKKMDSLMNLLFIAVSRHLNQASQHRGEDLPLLLDFQKARLQILSHCDEEWSTERMCHLVNLGKSQFFSYYKLFFHNTPKAELLAARLDKAKDLLTNEAMQVQQAALLSGFRSLPHFTKYFKEACGCPPSEYAAMFHKGSCKEQELSLRKKKKGTQR